MVTLCAGLGRRAAEQPGQRSRQRRLQRSAAAWQWPHCHQDAVLCALHRVGAPLQSLNIMKHPPQSFPAHTGVATSVTQI